MKNKIIYLSAICGIFIIAALLYIVGDEGGSDRYHQHLQAAKVTVDDTGNEFSTHLPIVTIDTGGQEILGAPVLDDQGQRIAFTTGSNGEETIKATISVVDQPDGKNQTEDKAAVTSSVLIRQRGNSSRHFDKKSYSMKLIHEDGTENTKKMTGMSSFNEWVLNGPFLDRTLIRNYMCYNIAGEIMEYAPNVRYCELFIDGTYKGLYLMMESISVDKNRIHISKPADGKSQTSYIARWDRSTKGDNLLNNYTFYTSQAGVSALDVQYPGKKKITPERMEYIEDDISKIEKVLYSYDLKEYTEYIDVESFAEYFVINEFFRNVDAGHFSTFLYKDIQENKIKLCVWDFNNACDNYVDFAWDESGFSMQDAPWFEMLLKDEKFVDLVISKYHQLRKTYLKEAYLTSYIDDTIDYLGDAVDRNYEVWDYVFRDRNDEGHNYLLPINRNMSSYEQSVTQLKSFIQRRGRWLDAHIDTLYQYCQESKTKDSLLK